MNCSESEKLFDAYLEGELRGSLRLEFEAHRVRCAQCQQTLAMLEAIGSVISGEDPELPELSSNFSDRVLAAVHPPRTVKFPHWKTVAAGAALVQAAAVLTLAVLWSQTPDTTLPPTPNPPPVVTVTDKADPLGRPGQEALKNMIIAGIEQKILDMHAAGVTLTEDMRNLARYANIELPGNLARESRQMAATSPLDGFLAVFAPPPPPADADESTSDDEDQVHAI